METKKCSKCNKNSNIIEFGEDIYNKEKKTFEPLCIECMEIMKIEAMEVFNKGIHLTDEELLKRINEAKEEIVARVKRDQRNRNNKQAEELHDNYIKNKIHQKYQLQFNEIDDELINAKRIEIKYIRQLTQLKNLTK